MHALRWDQVSVGYGKKSILEDVCISLPRGAFALMYGDNGSGKTSLVKTIREPQLVIKGSIDIATDLQRSMAYIPQQAAIHTFFPLSVFDTVAMGLYSSAGFFRSLYHTEKLKVQEMLASLKLEHRTGQLLGECSGGELKKALLGRALIKQPGLLIMDEPFVNVDDASQEIIIHAVDLYKKTHDMTVLVVSHGHHELKKYADLLLHVQQGRVHER